jgi:hypothetical protein
VLNASASATKYPERYFIGFTPFAPQQVQVRLGALSHSIVRWSGGPILRYRLRLSPLTVLRDFESEFPSLEAVETWVEDVKANREQLHTLGDLTIISVPAI